MSDDLKEFLKKIVNGEHPDVKETAMEMLKDAGFMKLGEVSVGDSFECADGTFIRLEDRTNGYHYCIILALDENANAVHSFDFDEWVEVV